MMVILGDVNDSGDGGGGKSSKVKGIDGGSIKCLDSVSMAVVVLLVVVVLVMDEYNQEREREIIQKTKM